MRRKVVFGFSFLALSIALIPTSGAAIHEMIGAACRAGGEEVVPPGQVSGNGMAFLQALQGSGIITSIDSSVPGEVTIHFDLTRPASKYMSAGFDLRIPDGAGPGVDLVLSPLPVPDPDFAAHANCENLRSP